MAPKRRKTHPHKPPPEITHWAMYACAGHCKDSLDSEKVPFSDRHVLQCSGPRCIGFATGVPQAFHKACLTEIGWALDGGPDGKFYCKPCLQDYEHESMLLNKINSAEQDAKDNRRVTCDHCQKSCADKSTLNDHAKYYCDGNPKRSNFSAKCGVCSTTHVSPRSLRQCKGRCEKKKKDRDD